MKTLTLLLAVAVTGTAALAQDNPSAAAPAAAANPAGPGAIKQFVYLARLPTPAELISEAQAQGMTISRIEESADRIVVVYQYADGSSQTYGYKLLSSATGSTAPAPVIEKVTVVEAPPPRVVYVEPETVYYSSPRYVRYYDPVWDFWSPVSIGINLGGHRGGSYHRGGSHYRGSSYNRGGYSGGHGGGRHGGHGGRRH